MPTAYKSKQEFLEGLERIVGVYETEIPKERTPRRVGDDGMGKKRLKELISISEYYALESILGSERMVEELYSDTYKIGVNDGHINSLGLGDLGIYRLSPEIKRLSKLRYLSLDNNPMERLPREIGELQDLEVITLSGANVSYLPKELCKLPKLRMIVADEAKIVPLHGKVLNALKISANLILNRNIRDIPFVLFSPDSRRSVNITFDGEDPYEVLRYWNIKVK